VSAGEDILDRLAAARPPAPPPLSPELETELGKLQPVAPRRPWRQLAMLALVSLVYAGGLVTVLTVRRDLRELPVAWLVGAGAAWLAGFVVPSLLALVPRQGSVMPRWQWAAVAAIITSVGFVALGWNVHPSGPSSADYGWEHLLRGRGCMWLGLATALVPVVIGAIFLRGALPVRSRWTAAALGAGGGCLGGLLLHMHCPIADKFHVALVHGGVVLVAAVLSAAIVPRATDRALR
jgi:hypothetical protein